VTLHGIVSFFFNVMVIALTVGLVVNAIQNGRVSPSEADDRCAAALRHS